MKPRLVTRILLAAVLLSFASAAMATTWYVNGVSGSDGNNCTSATTACKTIQHAIALAVSGDTIKVAAATYTENLVIGTNLKILGATALKTVIDGGGVGRVINVSSPTAHVTLSGLTITHGVSSGGAGIYNNSGTLTVMNSTIHGNTVPLTCPPNTLGCSAEGGGILNDGTGKLTISNSTISGNIATIVCQSPPCTAAAEGGGIFNTGTLTISNSTIANNTATGVTQGMGGGISNYGVVKMISNGTIASNSAKVGTMAGTGGGISGTVALQNTIVAYNTGGNCNSAVTSKGYNLSSDSTCNLTGAGDLNGTDPQLFVLQNNGGPTQTIALGGNSPALEAGNPSGCTDAQGHLLKTDQRGKPRPDKEDTAGCDIGAYEYQGPWESGDFITYSQVDWDAGGSAFTLLAANFGIVYQNSFGVVALGITNGTGFYMEFDGASPIANYLPASGPPLALNMVLIDPTDSSSGAFGGDVLALQLDVDFNDAGVLKGNANIRFGDLTLCKMSAPYNGLNGMMVRQVLALDNVLLGGGTGKYSISDMDDLTFYLTVAFGGGVPLTFANQHLCP